jgi:hypothetical protein
MPRPKQMHERLNFFLTREMRDALRRLHDRDGVAESETIRRALAEYLTRKGVLKKSKRA